jgi:formate dehydrogenase major subunit
VRLRSENGAVRLRVHITDRVEGKVLFLGIHDRGTNAVNQLTSDARDPTTHTGAYKEIPVALEKVPTDGPGESPLSSGNPRRYRGVSQRGIRIEEKWKRPDYVSPLE